MAKRILLVDDTESTLDYIQSLLVKKGYAVDLARNGTEALDIIEQNQPDLIVADILMPGMDGFAFYKKLRQTKKDKKIPFIVLTARPQMEDTFLAQGIEGFLTKPIDPEKFLLRIAAYIGDPLVEIQKSKNQNLDDEKRVFLCGRTKSILDKMTKAINSFGCDVFVCFKGDDVVKIAVEGRPVLIILDILMHGKPTDDIVKDLRAQPRLKETKIVIFSNLGQSLRSDSKVLELIRTRAACMANGANKSIGDFQEETFLSLIKEFLPSLES